jgi:serine phosphatase RsbU (regulator of sigma subunit)/pSer/pThr/pTyr-binding forkhead associated (FHA) protein
MENRDSKAGEPKPAVLIVVNPSGNRSRAGIERTPFLIGRHADNNLVLRDNRVSRAHARISLEGENYVIEDLSSRHGTWVNGRRITRQTLRNSDRIEFGFQDSYKLTFSFEEQELNRILDQFQPAQRAPSNLGKLRALVEVARALQTSLSTDDVLTAVVDAALAVTGAERGFLMLQHGDELEISLARDRRGAALGPSDLKVPTSVIRRALRNRPELLSMNFDPLEEQGIHPETSVAHLELRSVVCVPLVRVRAGNVEETAMLSNVNETVGLLYMDSRQGAADLSAGNRELLQTLALEASTILENARLLEEERAKQHLEEELNIAREIQNGLLPSQLPSKGWFRAAGSSVPSHQVGGDYFDVRNLHDDVWSVVIADVSGKGVSSALLASLLQGAFMVASDGESEIERLMGRVNRYLYERTKGEKYATVFYCTVDASGLLRWSNAGHCAPLLVHCDARVRTLRTTGLPLGMLEVAEYHAETLQLEPGDKIVAYSDGLTEAESPNGVFFGMDRLKQLLREHAHQSSAGLHEAIKDEVSKYTEGAILGDDITLVVLEYQPASSSAT